MVTGDLSAPTPAGLAASCYT